MKSMGILPARTVQSDSSEEGFRIPFRTIAGRAHSELTLGTAQLGMEYGVANRTGKPARSLAVALVREAIAYGVTHLDTARGYGDSEAVLAEALQGPWRSQMEVVTKLDPLAALPCNADAALVRSAVDQSIAASCRALNTTRLQVLLLHRWQHRTSWNGAVWQRLVERQAEGTVGVLGASIYQPEEALEALRDPAIHHLQLPMNLLDWRWKASGVDRAAAGRPDVVVHARSALLQGVLLQPPESWPEVGYDAEACVRKLRDLVHQCGCADIAELCLAYLRAQSWITSVVVGCETREQLQQNLSRFRRPQLTADRCAEIERTLPAAPEELLNPTKWKNSRAVPIRPEAKPNLVVAIVQARMSSTRLPGKVLADIAGHPMLWHVVQRLRRARLVHQIVVATSDNPADDSIAQFCQQEAIGCWRGSETDVLDRYYQAARAHSADTVVRVTADCPLIDPAVVDRVVQRFLDGGCDYVSNTLGYTYPDGLDAEAFSYSALEQAWREASKHSEREHVTPFLRGGRFRTASVLNEQLLPGSLRWTVDEPSDLEFVRQVFAALAGEENFGMSDVLSYLGANSAAQNLNSSILSNEGYFRSLYHEAVAGAAPKRPLEKSLSWFRRSQKVIPGCAQTFSKGHTQYVEGVAPLFLERGKGCRVWDVDGNEYIDYVQGLLPNLLGYAHEEVNAAVARQLSQGHSFSLPHPLEVELAERLTRLIPCAEMVRFGKNGSDATSGAVRAARALTRRDRVACCGYHGWQDWYIGSTTRNAGVPAAVRALTHSFPYNDLPALEKLLEEHPGEFAAVIMEPVNFSEPARGYLQGVRQLAHRHGALLIFDEICSGFHFGLGGAQKRYNVFPDMACFGKAMGNGFPIACVVGRADVMKTFEEIFFSFTFGGEVASMAAALKVLDILETTDALARMEAQGRTLQDGFNALAKVAGLSDRLACIGHPTWSLIKFRDAEGKDSLLLRSLVSQELGKRGILSLVTHNMTAAHDSVAVQQTLETYAAVFKTVAGWLQDPAPERFIEGRIIQPVFRVR